MEKNEIIQKIISTFPEIKEDIESDEDLFYLQISTFSSFAQNAIDNKDKKTFSQICELIRSFLLSSSGDTNNALHVSFLEHLHFEDSKRTSRSWAYEVMPKIMKESYNNIMKYNEELFRSDR